MDVQNKFWQDLIQVKFEVFYLDEYLYQSYSRDNYINMITAITSSSSIAAWAIWSEYNYIWGAFIAISQVINAIKIYLPYNKRTKYLNKFSAKVSELYNKYDYKWLEVSDGSMKIDEINDLVYELRKENQIIYNDYLMYNVLPKKQKLIQKADVRLEEYFDKYLLRR